MMLKYTLDKVFDEIITTVLEEAIQSDQDGRYKLIIPINSRIMIVSRNGMPAAILKTLYVGATKHALLNTKRICSELASAFDRFAAYQPSVGVLVAGNISASAREYMQKAGIKFAVVDYIAIQTVFADIGADVSNLHVRHNFCEDQLDQAVERLLDANRLSLSVLIKALLYGAAGSTPGATTFMLPGDLQAMAESTKSLSDTFIDVLSDNTGDNVVRSKPELTAQLKDILDTAYCSGYRQGRTSTVPVVQCQTRRI